MIHTIDSENDIAEAARYLCDREPRFVPVIEATGLPPLRRSRAGLEGLLAIITEQQISVHAAAAIWARVKEQFAPFDIHQMSIAGDDRFAACGLSQSKIRTIRAVLAACRNGQLDFNRLDTLSDEEISTQLTGIRGIGPWTAEIYLLTSLGRRDVWPKGDLALQEAARLLFKMRKRPDLNRMDKIARKWRPWRAVAARLLWAHYRHVRIKAKP